MTPREIDPLYAGASPAPDDAERHRFAGVELSVAVTDTDPSTAAAQWMADREVTLFLTDDVTPDTLRAVLPSFRAYAATRADRPTMASFALPSRDVDRCHAARQCGFWSGGVLAVCDLRRADRPVGPAAPAISDPVISDPAIAIRDATVADADALAALWWQQAVYEARVGVLRATPAIRDAITARMPELLAGDTTVLLADQDGTPVGAVVAESPDGSAWVASPVAATPVSYLAMGSTAPQHRGAGIGTMLTAALHARQRAAGIAVSVLHYSTPNPLSVPFWSQRGYRPLMSLFSAPVGD